MGIKDRMYSDLKQSYERLQEALLDTSQRLSESQEECLQLSAEAERDREVGMHYI